MSKALLVGDIHLSDRSPANRTTTYKQDILDKLKHCVTAANKLNVPIVQMGDTFHLKAPSKNSHRLVQEIHEVLKETKNGVWFVIGNHDIVMDRLDSIDSQPLGALSRMNNMHLLIGKNKDLPGIAGISYLTEFDGGDWRFALQNGGWVDVVEGAELLVTHAPLFPIGQAPEVYASIDPEEWAEFWAGYEISVTAYGHIHDSFGTFKANGHTFCNQGALSRGSLHETSVNRKPAVTFWDGDKFHRIEVPHKAPEEVFLFEQAAAVAQNKISVVEFAKTARTANLTSVTRESILDHVRTLGTRREVVNLIETILEG